MSIDVQLPDLGDGIESGDILEILVREGDDITKDQGVVEIETDKATVEVPSSAAGRVVKIHVSPGQTVPVGATLVSLEGTPPATSAPDPSATAAPPVAPPAHPEPSAASSAATIEKTPPPADLQAPATPAAPPATPQLPPTPTAPAAPAPTAGQPPKPSGTVPAAGPAVRRFAREVGVDLALVSGTGAGGRITRDDVLHVVRHASRAAQTGTSQASAAEPTSTAPGEPSTDQWGPTSLQPLTKIRKTIAARMHESWSTVPRVTNFDDADVTELEKVRQTSKQDYATAGIKLTSMPFVIKAIAMALRKHPLINASLDLENNQIVYKQYIHIGIAVDTDRGLVVPALRNADRLSIADTARELANIVEKARNNKFTIEDLRGTTFSVSNLGAIGGTYSTPIVNVPELAILLVGRSRKLPVVIDDQVVVRLMMPLSISYDHRLIDGGGAARFLNDVIHYLEAPGRLLLAP